MWRFTGKYNRFYLRGAAEELDLRQNRTSIFVHSTEALKWATLHFAEDSGRSKHVENRFHQARGHVKAGNICL